MEVQKQDILDLRTPALSSTDDMPVIETKPDASPVKEEVKEVETAPPAEEIKEPAAEVKSEEPAPLEKPDDAAAEPEPKKAKGVQKRIDELTRQREDERRRAEAAEARLDRALSALEKPVKTETPDDEKGPQKPVFDANNPEASNAALEQYVLDRASWVAERKVKATLAEDEKKRQDERIAQETKVIQESFKSRVEKVKEKYQDYSEVAESPDVQVSIVMASAIAHAEDGPEIAYFLGKNPAEAERISKLVPQLQLVELGKISQRLIIPPTTKPVSAAPSPGKPIKASSETTKPLEELTMEEYAARRKKQLAEERRPGRAH